MCSSGGGLLPDVSSLRAVLNTVWPQLALESLHIIPVAPALQHRLQRIYELRVPPITPASPGDGLHDMLLLVLGPSSMLRLLRSEQWIVKSEAVVVKWIRAVLLAGTGSPRTERNVGSYGTGCSACGEAYLEDADLLRLLPTLIDHSQSSKEFGSAYNILSHLDGLPLSSLPKCLSMLERRQVDFQIGRLIRRLSHLRSPLGKFGPAVSVLCPTAVTKSSAGGGMDIPGGIDSWRVAFHAILEGILRDAEDAAVTLPYQPIRRHFRRLAYCLDGVTVPRLVILDAAHDANIMAQKVGIAQDAGTRGKKITPTALAAETTAQDLLDDSGDSESNDDGTRPRRQTKHTASSIRVTGLRDWSNCVFGDPLLAMVFSSDMLSREFQRGFSGRSASFQPRRADHDSLNDEDGGFDLTMRSNSNKNVYGDTIDAPEEAHIRLLLYQCYHAAVAVVKEFYRPRSDSTRREFAARKRLNAVLGRLAEIEGDSKRGHVRPSGEGHPAKKPRTHADRDAALIHEMAV